ncbi:flocculation protein FLO11-like [Apis laboriosa]|uniref:flocculation protein FLO11-like n=1 Tax=Apis laboriosa TaxID=183418 RepID=UPI001CC7ACE2|nr:flocculation protein FLO11-like [Apis laboriosa]
MKLPLLQLAISILLTVPASSWPYRGTVGDRESTVLVGPVYGLSPVSLLPAKPELLGTVIRGPATGTTFVEGSSSGPVTIVSPGTPANAPRTTPSPAQTVVSGAPEDTVLIKGASAGAVTLVAPSDNSIANNASAQAEAKKGGGAAASAAVAIENAEESSSPPIKETIGVASANAVIGPSTGPIIIAGPTAPPLPIPVSTSEQPVAATVVETNSHDSLSVTSTATANLSVSGSITTVERAEDEGPGLATDSTESRKIEGTASSTSTVTTTSGSITTASATARVNLISPASTIAVGPLSNVVVSPTKASSAIVSGPLGAVSTASVSSLDQIKTPLHPL